MTVIGWLLKNIVPSFVTDWLLHRHTENVIRRYPNLGKIIPAKWPRGNEYGITNRKMHEFQAQRLVDDNSIDGMNLPLLIHNIDSRLTDEKSRQVWTSIMDHFDWFAREFADTPGFRRVLEPLWDDSWSPMRLWAVAAEIYLSRFLKENGFQIDGFDRTISGAKKTADIATIWKGTRTWIDVETHRLTKPVEGGPDDFRKLVEGRALKKIDAKFKTLAANEIGIVASVYLVNKRALLPRFSYMNDETKPVPGRSANVFSSVYWLIIGTPLEGPHRFGLHLIDRTLKTERVTS